MGGQGGAELPHPWLHLPEDTKLGWPGEPRVGDTWSRTGCGRGCVTDTVQVPSLAELARDLVGFNFLPPSLPELRETTAELPLALLRLLMPFPPSLSTATGCVTLGRPHNLSVPQFPYQSNWSNNHPRVSGSQTMAGPGQSARRPTGAWVPVPKELLRLPPSLHPLHHPDPRQPGTPHVALTPTFALSGRNGWLCVLSKA